MYLDRFEVSITVDASGNGTGFTPIATGYVQAVRYVPDVSAPYATGVDVTVTGETSGIAIVTITNAGTSAIDVYPRAATAGITNAAALYAAAGTGVFDRIPVAAERIKIALAQGGNATTGKFHVFVG